jgi:hypothetical protein
MTNVQDQEEHPVNSDLLYKWVPEHKITCVVLAEYRCQRLVALLLAN